MFSCGNIAEKYGNNVASFSTGNILYLHIFGLALVYIMFMQCVNSIYRGMFFKINLVCITNKTKINFVDLGSFSCARH